MQCEIEVVQLYTSLINNLYITKETGQYQHILQTYYLEMSDDDMMKYAYTPCPCVNEVDNMVRITIAVEIAPSKQKEFVQTVDALTAAKHAEPGFLGAVIACSAERADRLTILETWATPADVAIYLDSRYYAILCGGIQVLALSAEIEYPTESGALHRERIYQCATEPVPSGPHPEVQRPAANTTAMVPLMTT